MTGQGNRSLNHTQKSNHRLHYIKRQYRNAGGYQKRIFTKNSMYN
jgi:hypothetical protein